LERARSDRGPHEGTPYYIEDDGTRRTVTRTQCAQWIRSVEILLAWLGHLALQPKACETQRCARRRERRTVIGRALRNASAGRPCTGQGEGGGRKSRVVAAMVKTSPDLRVIRSASIRLGASPRPGPHHFIKASRAPLVGARRELCRIRGSQQFSESPEQGQ
jgi:hypothetical protein